MNNGKEIEKVVCLIQETLKDFPNIIIHKNFKIKSFSSRVREIDILIESKICDLDIKIAIECKDYKNAVPIKEIEAFNSKCSRIKGISKKVFVSTNGYQAESIEAANDFDIELYNINDINSDIITKWFAIKQLKTEIRLRLPFKIGMIGEKKDIKRIDRRNDIIVHFDNNDESIQMVGYVWNNLIVPKHDEIRAHLLLSFMKRKSYEPINKHHLLPFKIEVNGIYTINADGKKLPIVKIESEVETWLEESNANIIKAHSYSDNLGNVKANLLTIDVGKNERADIVISGKNKYSMFHTDSTGKIIKLETIARYDPKTDKIEYI